MIVLMQFLRFGDKFMCLVALIDLRLRFSPSIESSYKYDVYVQYNGSECVSFDNTFLRCLLTLSGFAFRS